MANTALPQETVSLVATASPSAASTIDFTGLTSDYTMYEFMFLNVDPSADGILLMQTSTDNGSSYDSSAGNYEWSIYVVDTVGTQSDDGGSGDTAINLTDSSGGAGTNENISGWIRLHRPSDASYGLVTWHLILATTGGTVESVVGGGRRLSAADIDAVRFSRSSGTMTGEIRVYGYKNA